MTDEVRPVDAKALEQYSHPSVRGTYGYSAKAEDWVVSVGDIRKAPTLDYEPVRYAHWIPSSGSNPYACYYRCSNCGKTIVILNPNRLMFEYPYCNCGCKMRREDKNEN